MALCDLPELTLLLLPLLARLSAGDCPCSEAALCQPSHRRPDFEVSAPLPVGLTLKAVGEVLRSLSSLNHQRAFLFSDFFQRLGNFPGHRL